MRIVILDGYAVNPGDNPEDALRALGELTVYDRSAPHEVIERARDADIVVANKVKLNADTLAALPRLKHIAVAATGYDVVDVAAAGARGVSVSNVVAYGVDAVAQQVMALLLELCRGTALHDASVKQGDWGNAPDFCYWKKEQIELTGLTMGLVAFGAIGRKVGELAHAFGMNVIACNRSQVAPPVYQPFSFVDMDTLFKESHVVSLHCPLTDATRGLVNARRIAAMRPGAFLINTARGALLQEDDVAAALHTGQLGGLGADVLSMEPPAADNPLLSAPNTLITPHIAWATLRARKNIMRMVADNIRAFMNGVPQSVVNTQFLKQTC